MFLFPIRVCIEDAFECVGVEEARNGGKLIKEAGLEFDDMRSFAQRNISGEDLCGE